MEVSYQKYSEDDDYCKWTLSVASNNMLFILEQLSYIEGAWNEVEEHTYDKTLLMRAAENSLYFNKGDLIATLRWSAT